jgi:antitoxin HicB
MLDPTDGNVTIETLRRAAEVVGRRVQLDLACVGWTGSGGLF